MKISELIEELNVGPFMEGMEGMEGVLKAADALQSILGQEPA